MKQLLILFFSIILLSSFVSASIENNTIWEHYPVDNADTGVIHGRNGTNTNGIYNITHKLGTHSISFIDGTQYFTTPAVTVAELTSWCMNFWWRPNIDYSGDVGYRYLWLIGTGGTDRMGFITNGEDGTSGLTILYSNGNDNFGDFDLYQTNITAWNNATWNMITTSYDGVANRYDVYINGSIQRSRIDANMGMENLADSGLIINTYLDHLGTQGLNAKYDSFLLRNTSCSSADASFLFNTSSGLYYTNFIAPPPTTDYFLITANDNYGNTLNIFNATMNGTVYSTTTGTINTTLLNNISQIFNITVKSPFFFNNFNNSVNISVDHTQVLIQSEISFNAFDRVSLNQLLNFTINDSSITNTTTSGNSTLNLLNGTQTLSFFNTIGYYNISFAISVSPLDNLTFNISNIHNHKLTFFAINNISGGNIENFTINLTSGSYNESLTAIGNNITFNISNSVNYTSIIDGQGFAIHNATHNSLTGLTSTFTYNLRTTNSLLLTFIDAGTLLLMNGTNITVQFIGDTKQTNVTDTGSLFVELFVPDEYTIVFVADNYRQGQYIMTIVNRSTQNLTLYMSLINDTSLILVSVNDKFGNTLSEADITIQRYLNNSWITEQIIRTDFQGRSESYFILSTVYYNFLIDYQGSRFFGIPNNDADKKVIYAEDVNTGLNFFIDISGINSLIQAVSTSLGVNVNISFVDTSGNKTSGYFRFIYDDPDNTQRTACIQVIDGLNAEICSCASTQVTSESSTITCIVNQTTGRLYYQAVGIIDGYTVASFSEIIGFDERIDWGLTGFFLGFIMVIVSYFIFINQPSISLLFGTIMFISLSLMGVFFKDISFTVWLVLLVIMYIIANIRSNSGVNG